VKLQTPRHKLRTLDLFSSPHAASHRHCSTIVLAQPTTFIATQHHDLTTRIPNPFHPQPSNHTTATTPHQTTEAPATPATKNETPHPQLPHLRPQSLQTRTLSLSPTPPRRRTRTRGSRSESRVSCQCTAEIGLEGY
jgi:hypothetical protein